MAHIFPGANISLLGQKFNCSAIDDVRAIPGWVRVLRKLKRGGIMPDGREERIERETRLEQEKQENRDDRFDRDTIEEWEPERVDS
jgi:hypothetical protein